MTSKSDKIFAQQLTLLATLSTLDDEPVEAAPEPAPEPEGSDVDEAAMDAAEHGAGFPGAMGNSLVEADGPASRLPAIWLSSRDRKLPLAERREIEGFIQNASGRYVAVRWTRRWIGTSVDFAGPQRDDALWQVADLSNCELLPPATHCGIPCKPKAGGGVTWEQAAYKAEDPDGGRVGKASGAE